MKQEFVVLTHFPRAQMAADAAGIAEAARILRHGGLVAVPTETVYGLAADAASDAAVARIYAAKARPKFNPLIAHVANLEAALGQGIFSADALRLAEAFWPGPLTLVIPLAPGAAVCAASRAGQPNIALRVPIHPVALAVISAAGRPLAAPSANRSGRVSPVTAAHVARDFGGEVDLILDGGRCPIGLESTIISCLERPLLLRPGGIARTARRASISAGFLARARMCWIFRPAGILPRRRQIFLVFCVNSMRETTPA